MIPVQLTIEGLYSYQERQTIDFQNLTDAGLFGIFGKVGSGKSSILEAISYALYGETERLNSRDKRTYNMMNLKSDRSYIAFDFYNYEDKLYRATREFKRNSKNFEDIKSPTVTFYEYKNHNWIPLENADAEKLIGLSYTNFKRTIIIPQGQFKEFLELGETDRTKMMSEIFSLGRYDLYHKTKVLNDDNKTNLDQLQGELKGFESISVEEIEIQKEILITSQLNFNSIQKEHQIISEKFQRLKLLKSDIENLNLKKKQFESLKTQQKEIEDLQLKLDNYEKIHNAFHQTLLDLKKIQQEKTSKSSEEYTQQQDLEKLENHFQQLSQELSEIKVFYEQLPEKKMEENDLDFMVQILKYSSEIEVLEERTLKGQEKVKEVENQEAAIKNQIEKSLKEADDLKKNRLDSQLLMNVGNWFIQQKNREDSIKKQRQKVKDKQEEIDIILSELKAENINVDLIKENYQTLSEQYHTQKTKLEHHRNQLEVQEKLSHYAHNLQEGENCPLCGSREHPNIVLLEDVSKDLQDVKQALITLEKQRIEQQNKQNEIEKTLSKKLIFQEQNKVEHEILTQLENDLKEHKKAFTWSEFCSENELEFQEKRALSLKIEAEIDLKNKHIEASRNALEIERKNVETYKALLDKFKIEEAQKATQIESNKRNLKVLTFENFYKKSIEDVENLYKGLVKSNKETEENHQSLTQKINEISPKLSSQKTLVSTIKIRLSELEKEENKLQEKIKNSLLLEQIDNLEAVENILNQDINSTEIRNTIQQFNIKFETLKSGIAELEEKLKGVSFDENHFHEIENHFKNLELQLKDANDHVVKISAEIERLEKEFKKKETLLIKQSELEKRSENLKTMLNLFKGAGFVQYVSSIYLRQLCDHANMRFHRMTRNQLSLQLNEKGDFEIIDYLNEGRSRSVKTLSGGQGFQASLSLALALAESVQSNAKSDKNFFFIDEGFGTQDSDSVNIVFETLMSLQKENRIVGIISHVEELKERIPMSLNVEKDEEKGSLITIA